MFFRATMPLRVLNNLCLAVKAGILQLNQSFFETLPKPRLQPRGGFNEVANSRGLAQWWCAAVLWRRGCYQRDSGGKKGEEEFQLRRVNENPRALFRSKMHIPIHPTNSIHQQGMDHLESLKGVCGPDLWIHLPLSQQVALRKASASLYFEWIGMAIDCIHW